MSMQGRCFAVNIFWHCNFEGSNRDICLVLQGCAVVVEANQLESGQKAHIRVSSARSGCFLQPEVMEVGVIV